MNARPRVGLVVLNWNNGRDTLDCLDSVLEVADPAVAGILVCDNGSTDDSVARILDWGERRVGGLLNLGTPAAAGADPSAAARLLAACEASGSPPFALVQTGANLGYAGGNNVGLRLLLECGDAFDAALVLNNDTLLTPGCVSAMVRRLRADPAVGMCGATVVFARDGRQIQARAGARYEPWLGRAHKLGAFEPVDAPADPAVVEAQLDYVLGAALLVSRDCLRRVGPMHEAYFLYFEEIDWCLRARRAGFALGYAPEAVVLHKEGGTIGSSHHVQRRSLLSDHYLTRSRVRFTGRFYPWFLPTVFLYSVMQVARHVLNGDRARAVVQARALCGRPWQASARH